VELDLIAALPLGFGLELAGFPLGFGEIDVFGELVGNSELAGRGVIFGVAEVFFETSTGSQLLCPSGVA